MVFYILSIIISKSSAPLALGRGPSPPCLSLSQACAFALRLSVLMALGERKFVAHWTHGTEAGHSCQAQTSLFPTLPQVPSSDQGTS